MIKCVVVTKLKHMQKSQSMNMNHLGFNNPKNETFMWQIEVYVFMKGKPIELMRGLYG